MRFRCLAKVAALTLGALSPVAYGGEAFDNFGPNETFDARDGYFVAASGSGSGSISWATPFTAAEGGELLGFHFALCNYGGDQDWTVALFQDNAGSVGSQMEEVTSAGPLSSYGQGYAPVDVELQNTGVYLNAGQQYWFGILGGGQDSTGVDVWNINPRNENATMMLSHDGGVTWSSQGQGTSGAYSVEVSGVPEPGPFIVLGAGMVAFVRSRRKKPAA